jgi:acetolactate synthase-1/2/3 large subunit
VARAAGALRGDGPPAVLLLGGEALLGAGLRAAERVARATGCALLAETFPRRMERGGGLVAPRRLPYFPEPATAALGDASALVLAGAPAPVAFFAYPGLPGELVPPGLEVHELATPEQDAVEALERLAELVEASGSAWSRPPERPRAPAPEPPRAPAAGPLTPERLAAGVAAWQPEDAIVVDEWLTLSEPYVAASAGAPAHTYLALTGGAIGWGLPAATGAALAQPARPVLALQADGSGMYTVQALWTQARERLDVTTVVAANGTYRILQVELARAGVPQPGPRAASLTDLGAPPLDWVALAAGMGVPAERVETTQALAAALARAAAEPGPHLVEAVV